MRVAHVITRLIIGGAQENTVASVLGLREKPGMQVQLLSGPTSGPEGSLEPRLQQSPGVLRILPQLVRPVHPWKDLLALLRLTTWFKQDHPEIVHTHSGKAGVLGRVAAARAGVPVIVHTIHGPSFGAFQGLVANLMFRSAERYAAKATTHFIVVADAMRDQYLAAGIGIPQQYTRVLSGFDLDPFVTARNDPQLRAKLGIAPHDVVVGKIARLTNLKGHEDLFAIAPELVKQGPNVKFLLIGDGSLRPRFEELARSLGLAKHFIFPGLVAPEAVPAYLGVMDLLVHLSRREGLARALPQALAARRPIVAYDCDGAREVCLDDETGFLVPAGDRLVLQNRLLALLSKPALRERLGARGQSFVRTEFSVQTMVDKLYALYLRLTAPAEVGSERKMP